MVQISSASLPTAPRSAERKRQILEGASRVFRRRGLHGTGMRDIAKELGMHAGNLYYYFENKEELLAFCQQEALSGLLQLARTVRSSGEPPDAQLRALMTGHILRLNRDVPGSLAHLEIEALGEPARRRVLRRRDAYESAYRKILVAGNETGVFEVPEPKVAAMALLGALNWTVKWFRPEGGATAEEIAEAMVETLLTGVLSRRTTTFDSTDEDGA